MLSLTLWATALLLTSAAAAPAEKRAAAFSLQTTYNAGNWMSEFTVQNVCTLSALYFNGSDLSRLPIPPAVL